LGRRRVVRSPAADEDLIEIWGHIAGESKITADRVYDRIVKRIFDLADFPDMGPGRSEIAADLRSLTVMNYVILYRVETDYIEIIRVIHGARDLSSLM
jgi:toxin ParE1/3/4